MGAPDFGALKTSLTMTLFIAGGVDRHLVPTIVDVLDAGDVCALRRLRLRHWRSQEREDEDEREGQGFQNPPGSDHALIMYWP